MTISVFDLFTIGIGPSSSHTIGPMRAANSFVALLKSSNLINELGRLKVELYGSLGATGKGHGTDKAVLLGLQNEVAEEIDVDAIEPLLDRIKSEACLSVFGVSVPFEEDVDLVLHLNEALPEHSNGMVFTSYDREGAPLIEQTYFSIGGGFILTKEEAHNPTKPDEGQPLPYPFESAEELVAHCEANSFRISDLMMTNEKVWRSEEDIRSGLLNIWEAMRDCVNRGCQQTGTLPGGLNVKRRASQLYQTLRNNPEASLRDPLTVMDWVNLYALAVNEENAAGGRVVTAPTNGAAGIVPAVLHYYVRFVPNADEEGIIRFLLTAGAIGTLFKKNASISGAEVGCQGEVGSACSMAASGLAEVLGASARQIENAAEIAMEHNLGLTCDPVGGLVQVPCIERNAMASIKAINSARLACRGDGSHFVSLDKVIKTMRDTGADMQTKYKETSLGGLAVNVIEC